MTLLVQEHCSPYGPRLHTGVLVLETNSLRRFYLHLVIISRLWPGFSDDMTTIFVFSSVMGWYSLINIPWISVSPLLSGTLRERDLEDRRPLRSRY